MDSVLEHLTDDELAERICLLDLDIPEIALAVRGMTTEQIREVFNERLRRDIEQVRAEFADDEPSERRYMMLWYLEAMEAEDEEEAEGDWRHDLTNDELRQAIFDELVVQALTM